MTSKTTALLQSVGPSGSVGSTIGPAAVGAPSGGTSSCTSGPVRMHMRGLTALVPCCAILLVAHFLVLVACHRQPWMRCVCALYLSCSCAISSPAWRSWGMPWRAVACAPALRASAWVCVCTAAAPKSLCIAPRSRLPSARLACAASRPMRVPLPTAAVSGALPQFGKQVVLPACLPFRARCEITSSPVELCSQLSVSWCASPGVAAGVVEDIKHTNLNWTASSKWAHKPAGPRCWQPLFVDL